MPTPTDPVQIAEVVTETDNKFADEPKGDNPGMEEVEDAVFVEDKGDGTATLMKPKKPTLHHRGRDSHFNMDGDRIKNIDSLEEVSQGNLSIDDYSATKWWIVASSIFVFSSTLYLAMAAMVIDYYWWHKDTPRSVFYADDDATWWNYFINGTDDAFFPENVTNADDDYTWMVWYNESAFPEDDYVWLPAAAPQDAPWPESYVSKYQLLYFFAALGFIISGIIESVLARKSPLWIRAIYYTMIVAATFGLVSAILTNKSPQWSAIASCVSVNLWAIESCIIVGSRTKGFSEWSVSENYDSTENLFGWSIKNWLWIADISFMIGTWGDAITSWFYVFERDSFVLGVLAIVFAFFWLLCALIYFPLSIYDHLEFRNYMTLASEYEEELKLFGGKVDVVEEGGMATEKEASQDNDAPESAPDDPEKKIDKVSIEEN